MTAIVTTLTRNIERIWHGGDNKSICSASCRFGFIATVSSKVDKRSIISRSARDKTMQAQQVVR